VRGVADDTEPRVVEERARPAIGRQVERAERFSEQLECALGARCSLLDVDAVRCHAHEQVGARTRSELAGPRGEVVGRRVLHVLREAHDPQLVFVLDRIGLCHHATEPRLRHEVVGAVHPQHRAREQLAVLGHEVVDRAHEPLRIVRQVRAVAIALREVLGAHGRPVRRAPPEP
jgi:hypothetical protein